MSDENQNVPGQDKKPVMNLCGDCEYWDQSCACDHADSDRIGGRVDGKAAACELFKHN